LQIIFVNSRPAKVWFGNLFSRQLRVNAFLGKIFRPFLAAVLEENFTLLGNSASTQKMSDDIHEENHFPNIFPYIDPVKRLFPKVNIFVKPLLSLSVRIELCGRNFIAMETFHFWGVVVYSYKY
jgi:hypothetical protein